MPEFRMRKENDRGHTILVSDPCSWIPALCGKERFARRPGLEFSHMSKADDLSALLSGWSKQRSCASSADAEVSWRLLLEISYQLLNRP